MTWRNRGSSIWLVLAAALAGGCARYKVAFTSEPAGAMVEINGVKQRTPCVFLLPLKSQTAEITLDSRPAQRIRLRADIDAPARLGRIVTLPIAGLGWLAQRIYEGFRQPETDDETDWMYSGIPGSQDDSESESWEDLLGRICGQIVFATLAHVCKAVTEPIAEADTTGLWPSRIHADFTVDPPRVSPGPTGGFPANASDRRDTGGEGAGGTGDTTHQAP